MDALALVLRGVRNGAYYGTKIRAPHAAGEVVICPFTRYFVQVYCLLSPFSPTPSSSVPAQ